MINPSDIRELTDVVENLAERKEWNYWEMMMALEEIVFQIKFKTHYEGMKFTEGLTNHDEEI